MGQSIVGDRGERLRKREEERAIKRANKRRKLGKKPLEVDRSGGHEGRVKKHANKRRLEVCMHLRLLRMCRFLLVASSAKPATCYSSPTIVTALTRPHSTWKLTLVDELKLEFSNRLRGTTSTETKPDDIFTCRSRRSVTPSRTLEYAWQKVSNRRIQTTKMIRRSHSCGLFARRHYGPIRFPVGQA